MRLRRIRVAASSALAALAFVLVGAPARASNVTEVPDNGSEQGGRGGAWIARASDPLATAFNPAGLAGQQTRLTLQANILFQHTCFTRLKAANDTTFGAVDPLLDPTGHYPRVCNDIEPNVNPQLGLTLRITDRLGLGALVMGPAASGAKTWPEFMTDANGEPQPAPQRYLLTKSSGVVLFPTIGVGYEVIDDLRLGASVSWGFAKLRNAAATTGLNTDAAPASNDVRANVQVADYFIPRFSLGGIWSATPELDLAGWYQWTDAIQASGDVGTAANYYTKQNAQGNDSSVRYGDTIFSDCGTGRPQDEGKCGSGDNAKVKLSWPMEAKIGVRYHKPRAGAVRPHMRDPLSQDVFDVEANGTWANNSAIDAIQIRFPGDPNGNGNLPVAGIDGGAIPPNSDQIRQYKDVFGLRVGGDYNVMPDRLALRAGTFYETSAATQQYQNIDFAPAARFGLAFGGTYRIRLGTDEKSSALEIMVGYGHVFFQTLDREDKTASGVTALSGTACNKSDPDPNQPSKCLDGNDRYRTKWPVNLGTITNALNVINVGLAYKF